MTAHKLRTSRLLSPEVLAGWIFADILIVLFIVGLGAAAAPPAPTPTPTSIRTPTPTPTPTKTAPPALKPEAVPVVVRIDPDRLLDRGRPRSGELKKVCRQLDIALTRKHYDDDQAALVLIFGGGSNVEAAQRRAAVIGGGLKSCPRQSVFNRRVVWRDYWDGGLNVERARLEIFVYIKS